MFTGLIEAVCTVESVCQNSGAMRLTIDLAALAGGSKVGDSIAINGVCLTIAELNRTLAGFDVSGETLTKSTLGKLKPKSYVNAERAVMADGRFGGHFVQGHIDGKAAIKSITKQAPKGQGQFANMEFTASAELLDQMVVKGSVAVNGVSLTIADINKSGFGIAIIPKTLEQTTLARAKIGDTVNIETDIIVKAVKKQLDNLLPREQKLTVEKLKELGF
ncbi:MAG: riboflavin synthase [Planctomycetota bacterium]|nr:riboflavin synthase [Planctomycetota bacterium]